MSSLYLPAVQRSWLHQSHTATKAASRSPSPTPADGTGATGGEKREEILSAEQGINSRLAVDLQEQDFLRHINRADHLPGRGNHAQQARVMRNMYGYAPIGSMYDAQELSSEEEKWESKVSFRSCVERRTSDMLPPVAKKSRQLWQTASDPNRQHAHAARRRKLARGDRSASNGLCGRFRGIRRRRWTWGLHRRTHRSRGSEPRGAEARTGRSGGG